MNGWLIFLIMLVVVVITVTVVSRWLERKKMNKRTVETMGDKMFDEIEEERNTEIEKAKMFRKVLNDKMKE